jgi:hypothetical protein
MFVELEGRAEASSSDPDAYLPTLSKGGGSPQDWQDVTPGQKHGKANYVTLSVSGRARRLFGC